jgi:hypothetical protein
MAAAARRLIADVNVSWIGGYQPPATKPASVPGR